MKRSSTHQLITVAIYNATTGAPFTGLTASTSGLKLYYRPQGRAGAGIAVTLTAGTLGTWASGGFAEVDASNMPGVYEIGLPDAALTTGNYVDYTLSGVTNMAPVSGKIDLTAFDAQDAVRAGLTALPNANAAAAGGLPIGDAAGNASLSSALQQAIAGLVWDVLTSGHAVSGSFGLALASISTPPTVGAIADAVWNALTSTHTASGSFGLALGSGSGPTLSQIVNGVWDALFSGHTTSGSFAALLQGIASSANTAATQATTAAGYGAPPSASAIASAAATAILLNPSNKIGTESNNGVTIGTAAQAALVSAAVAALPTLAQIIAGIWNEALSSHTTSGSAGKTLADALTNAIAANSQSAAAVAFGAPPTANAIASAVASAVPNLSAIVNGVWDSLIASHTVSGSFAAALAANPQNTVNLVLNAILSSYTVGGSVGAALGNISAAPPNTTQIVNAIWNALLADHTTASTFGKAIADALSAANSANTNAATAAGFGAAPTVDAIATRLLRTAANKINTDAAGNVTPTDTAIAAIATAVAAAVPTINAIWNELASGHTTSGSFGAIISSILTHATNADSQSSTAASQAAGANTAANTAAGYGKAPTISQITAALPSLSQIVAALPSLAQILQTPGTPLANDSNGKIAINNFAAGLLDLADAIESGVTLRQAIKYMAATLAGTSGGAGTNNITFKAIGGTATRVSAVVDGTGDRTAVQLT